jgi:type I restriction enzyme S subunit
MAGEGWQQTKVDDMIRRGVLALNDGYRVRNVELGPVGIPFVRGGDIGDGGINTAVKDHIRPEFTDRVQSKLTRPFDVAFITKGTVGRVGMVRPGQPPSVFAPQVCYWRSLAPDQLEPRFLFYLLTSAEFQANLDAVKTHGSMAADYVSMTDQRDFRLTFPPIREQKAIAAVLGALDDKIELNRRMNATLEAMARALFQSWFVDFDPVRAKLDGRPPAALDPANAALFPEHFAHGEHEMLPVGWRLAAIEEVCAINAWTLGKNDDLETLEYVEISEVSRGNIANIATYPRGEEPSRARRRLRHGDTVLSTVRPDRGSYFLALNPPENRVASTGFAVLTPTKAPWSFIHAALTQPEVSDYLGQMADGGAYPAVRPEIIGAMQVVVPNEPQILEAFHLACAPLFEQAEAHRAQSRTLATLRDTLLPMLVSGEIAIGANE